ncbi:MAG: hypothetical protein IPM59_07720 [Chloracidobacterium sp.]|nr:hypothetical protein [Chloracidobacterium sp.]
MRFLLDVNTLVAFGHEGHQFYVRVAEWAANLAREDKAEFATTAICELGFVRIMSQVYGTSVSQAKELLASLKESDVYEFSFISDDHDASKLPAWVNAAKHTTDGHLVELAKENGCVLATLDEKIPGVFVIP